MSFFWTFGGSPLLYEDKLYVQVLQRNVPVPGRGVQGNESYLLALDPSTGRTLWRHVRPSQAVAESQESHTTPIPMLHAGRRQLLIAGGDALSGHDPATGKELWRWGDWNPSRSPSWPLIASPVAADGIALICVPKGTSKLKSDINRDSIAAYALTLGLQAVAMISVDEDLSALRLKVV